MCQVKGSAIILLKGRKQPIEGAAVNRKCKRIRTMKNSETLTAKGLTRQEFLKLSGFGLAGVTLLGTVGCGGGGGSSGEGLVFTSSGSDYQRAQAKAWLKPFSKETGTE